MAEIDEAASIIAKSVDPDADIIFGAVIDDRMMDQLKVTIIATKFDDNKLKLFKFRKGDELEKEVNKSVEKTQAAEELESGEDELNEDEELMEDSSEFDIPAFLRKK